MVKKLTPDQILAQIPGARKRGREAMAKPWWPMAAVLHPKEKTIAVTMRSGFVFVIPVSKLPGLAKASPAQLRELQLQGDTLSWEQLDVDISFSGLLAKGIGKNMLATETGRAGGMVSSAPKAEAARANGRLGGRPKKGATKPGEEAKAGRYTNPGEIGRLQVMHVSEKQSSIGKPGRSSNKESPRTTYKAPRSKGATKKK